MLFGWNFWDLNLLWSLEGNIFIYDYTMVMTKIYGNATMDSYNLKDVFKLGEYAYWNFLEVLNSCKYVTD